MLSNLRKKIDRVFNFVNLSIIYFVSKFIAVMCEWFELWLREHMPIHVPYLEERSIIWPYSILKVSVVSRPIIEIEPHTEYLAPQERRNIDALLKQDGEVL